MQNGRRTNEFRTTTLHPVPANLPSLIRRTENSFFTFSSSHFLHHSSPIPKHEVNLTSASWEFSTDAVLEPFSPMHHQLDIELCTSRPSPPAAVCEEMVSLSRPDASLLIQSIFRPEFTIWKTRLDIQLYAWTLVKPTMLRLMRISFSFFIMIPWDETLWENIQI